MTDFQLSIQPHDGVYKGYMNKNRNNVNAGDTPDMTNRFPFIEKPQLTVKQQITDIHQQTMGIPQLTTSIPQQTATNQQETTSFQQQTTAFQQHTNIQQQTTSIQQQTTSIQQQTTAIQQQTTNILPQPNDKQQQKTNVRQVAPQMSATTGRETRQIPTLLVPNLFTPPSPMQVSISYQRTFHTFFYISKHFFISRDYLTSKHFVVIFEICIKSHDTILSTCSVSIHYFMSFISDLSLHGYILKYVLHLFNDTLNNGYISGRIL